MPSFGKCWSTVNDDIHREVEIKMAAGKNPLERLRFAVTAIAMLLFEQRKIHVSLLHDLLNQNEDVTEFVISIGERRLALIRPLIEQCKKEGYLEPLPFSQIASFIATSVNFPIIISETLDRLPSKKLKFSAQVKAEMVSKDAILQRVDLAIKAVSRKGA